MNDFQSYLQAYMQQAMAKNGMKFPNSLNPNNPGFLQYLIGDPAKQMFGYLGSGLNGLTRKMGMTPYGDYAAEAERLGEVITRDGRKYYPKKFIQLFDPYQQPVRDPEQMNWLQLLIGGGR